jgi:SPX domain protein involved in polyphosphate accumulation
LLIEYLILIHTRNVKPKVIIEYNQATFEKHGMRITVDFDMKGQKVSSDNILNNLTINDSKSNTCGIFRLNYALLEVKTDNNLNPTDCIPIKSLLRKNLIRPLNAFNKFITVYYFYSLIN